MYLEREIEFVFDGKEINMRWKVEIERKPYHLEQRTITQFAFSPIKTEDGEVRWLERVTIKQTYLINPSGHWVNDCFVD